MKYIMGGKFWKLYKHFKRIQINSIAFFFILKRYSISSQSMTEKHCAIQTTFLSSLIVSVKFWIKTMLSRSLYHIIVINRSRLSTLRETSNTKNKDTILFEIPIGKMQERALNSSPTIGNNGKMNFPPYKIENPELSPFNRFRISNNEWRQYFNGNWEHEKEKNVSQCLGIREAGDSVLFAGFCL